MRNLLIAFGTLTLFAVSPALAGGASHVIGDDQPVSSLTDAVADRTEASYTVTLAYAPRGSRVAMPAASAGTSHVIGDDDQPVSSVTDGRR